jgi:hypothetical protein
LADTILSALQEKLRNDMNDLADHMAGGGCKSFEEYQKVVGIIEGLARAERELLDLAEAQERAE